ncbi:hypothetical protein SMACR_12743 [Sordaria macrospora]|uniref:WGS project CABT00000000 data, contig 2.21 n=2 Tax=Sordaria macrospora TaxID=5147 RepID=F7W277_SORMK|nr:uncharacterized protein SMAC_12743 [Sordaria macrospora k-hell]KAA8632291.1 hypothetical protein SMACR_12743 [Sordaria macrospora]WPJ61982.1 hypothetical protein SMAC4_12743 [Sordaria macrospora]CCC11727.1 unnamed protein product [Sordaria macrospora k-hell]
MIHQETTPITPDSDRDDGLETTSEMDGQSLVYQELPARLTNPVKLVALLRMQFGVGKYDVSMIGSVYSVGTPRKLSMEEISQCRGL